MFNRSIICIILLVALASSKITILNLPHGFVPLSESEYSDYLQAMVGHYVESSSTPDSIKLLINNERPSLLTAPEKVTIVLATLKGGEGVSETAVEMDGKQIRQIISKYETTFDVKVLLNTNEEQLRQEMAQLEGQGSLVNAIIGDEKAIQLLSRTLTPQTASSKRRLQGPTPTAPNGSYLIKFFFSLLFILVIVACVGFIAQNEGKKDTLLYAKFIADVGAR